MKPILVLVLLLVVLAFSCTDTGTEPQPMSHEFTWEIDTILPNAFEFIGLTFWGTSDSNVYLGGHDADGHQSLLRYNGTEWEPIDLFNLGLNTIQGIDGTDSTLFAVAGGTKWSHIAVYNNGVWDTIPIPRLQGGIQRMDFISPNEIYLAVLDGLLKYDGSNFTWIVDSSQVKYNQQDGHAFFPGSVAKGYDGLLYFTTVRSRIGQAPVYRLFRFDGKSCTIIEEADNALTRNSNQKGGMSIASIGKVLVTGYNSIYRLEHGVLTKLYDIQGRLFAGTNINNNIFSSSDKVLMHYNGRDWVDIAPSILKDNSQTFWLQTMYYIGKTLFVMGTIDGRQTLVIRGKYAG